MVIYEQKNISEVSYKTRLFNFGPHLWYIQVIVEKSSFNFKYEYEFDAQLYRLLRKKKFLRARLSNLNSYSTLKCNLFKYPNCCTMGKLSSI